ncbi:extracellular matrix regulator RemB [Pelotomaculum propionicicum]|uniref:extracellular matrix regulator RemB n=1 Tax=Pelotomaculum propionicicum TaxID=258475 RepID=UPI003B822EF8
MFLHLGADVVVLKKDIIAILDITTAQAAVTKEFIEIARDEGFIRNIYEKDREKSFVVTTRDIYMSPISCSTLKKRSKDIFEL